MQYLLGYACFLLGAFLHILGKIQEYKKMAKANPDPKINYSTKAFFSDEAINFAWLLTAGIALVIFLPMLAGSITVQFVNSSNVVVAKGEFRTLLLPAFFFIGYGGNSALLNLYGKYKNTFLNSVGVQSN